MVTLVCSRVTIVFSVLSYQPQVGPEGFYYLSPLFRGHLVGWSILDLPAIGQVVDEEIDTIAAKVPHRALHSKQRI